MEKKEEELTTEQWAAAMPFSSLRGRKNGTRKRERERERERREREREREKREIWIVVQKVKGGSSSKIRNCDGIWTAGRFHRSGSTYSPRVLELRQRESVR